MQKKTPKANIKKNKNALNESKTYAVVGIFLTIIGYIIVARIRPKDKYAMHYAKQGLALFIAGIIAEIINWVTGWIPIIGNIIQVVLVLFVLVLWILWVLGLIYALSGKEKDIPIIGPFSKKL